MIKNKTTTKGEGERDFKGDHHHHFYLNRDYKNNQAKYAIYNNKL